MKICIELELDADYFEGTDGQVAINHLAFVGCGQNILQYLSVTENDAAQQAVEEAVEQALIDKALAIREIRDMRGDHMRDRIKDDAGELRHE